MKKQILIISTITAVVSFGQASAGGLGGTLGGGLGGGLTGIGNLGGMGSVGGTLERPGAIDRVGAVGGRVKDKVGETPAKLKDKAEPAATNEPAKTLDLGGNLGGDLQTKHTGAAGQASGAAKASRSQGVTLDRQSSGNLWVGEKPAPEATTTTP
ncbi:MAG: hypothetical protein ABIT36_05465 [Steroidobacteraceae bacterium]